MKDGVIKFESDLRPLPMVSWTPGTIRFLTEWRSKFKYLGWIGKDENGIGFGNLSMRLSYRNFLVTGTQTEHLQELLPEHYVKVTAVDFKHNKVLAFGQILPSSECMTHAAVYETNPDTNYVFHIHCAALWKKHDNIPVTNTLVEYGTPEMAEEVKRVIRLYSEAGAMILGGHENGLLSWGGNAEDAGWNLLKLYKL